MKNGSDPEAPAGFERINTRGFYRPLGSVLLGELADRITDAVRRARAEELSDLLINITAVTGFESPEPAYRRWVVRRWAAAAENRLRVAMVARAEHICPHRTGVVVAAEVGLQANIFETETEALQWLDREAMSYSRSAGAA